MKETFSFLPLIKITIMKSYYYKSITITIDTLLLLIISEVLSSNTINNSRL